MIDTIFNARVDELATLTEEDRLILEANKEEMPFDELSENLIDEQKAKVEQFVEIWEICRKKDCNMLKWNYK